MPNTKEKKRPRGSSSSVGDDDSKILDKLTSIQDRIENGFTKIDTEIDVLRSELKCEIKSIKEELSQATKSLNAVWEEVKLLKEKNLQLEIRLDSTAKENSNLKEEVNDLKQRLVKQEDYSRRENLRFYNIPESPEENIEDCVQMVKEVLSELGAPPTIKFHAIHRTGKPNDAHKAPITSQNAVRSSRPRPIIVRFVSRMDADSVWMKRKELLKSSRFPTVLIDKDLSVESARERGKLRAGYRKAKELNIEKVFIRGKKLFVNSDSYFANNLPEYLLPKNPANNQQSSNPA